MKIYMEKARVELQERSYDVIVGEELLCRMDELLAGVCESRGWPHACVVTDENVGPLYAPETMSALQRLGLSTTIMTVEAGERSKTAEAALGLIEDFAHAFLSRRGVVVALGGGVVGDLAGFAASVFKRGVDILQLPTTLMAQVDASIGGKTAVNLGAGKNLIGTFHQPVAVLCDVKVLETLPHREYRSGLAEVAKYAFIEPEALGMSLQGVSDEAGSSLIDVIRSCAEIKARVVSVDEHDRGMRAVLNYGHTLGHALEAVTGYTGEYTHGEAVSIGMVYAALVAEGISLAEKGLASRHRELLDQLALPVAPIEPVPEFGVLAAHMAHDKKSDEELKMVLLESEGKPVVLGRLDMDVLARCYERLLGGR